MHKLIGNAKTSTKGAGDAEDIDDYQQKTIRRSRREKRMEHNSQRAQNARSKTDCDLLPDFLSMRLLK